MVKATYPTGLRIVRVREMTKNEFEAEGWDSRFGAVTVIELEDGSLLYASQDPEGNGPGALFGKRKDGETFALEFV